MPILNRLYGLYEGAGFTVSSGLSPEHSGGHPYAAFTWLLKDGKSFSNGLGIALQEIYFLENLFERYRPEKVLVIGNSFGWSTLAVGLLNPEARVVALDACFDENADAGLALTNDLAGKAGIDVRAVEGVSPRDLAVVIGEHLGGRVDFCFIDGLHTNEQVFEDYAGVRPFMPDDGVYLFHDVLSCGLGPGLARIEGDSGRNAEILYGTPSGMALLCLSDGGPLSRTVRTFKGAPEAMDLMRNQQRQRKHRHLFRWRRSIAKRLDRLLGG
ncbi:MAG: class I SAM-dependent methyltransferase [Rhodospirillaceae bacterium]